MMKFTYCTGNPVWIAPEHIVSIRQADDPEITLIRTVDGEQFAVEGELETILAALEAADQPPKWRDDTIISAIRAIDEYDDTGLDTGD